MALEFLATVSAGGTISRVAAPDNAKSDYLITTAVTVSGNCTFRLEYTQNRVMTDQSFDPATATWHTWMTSAGNTSEYFRDPIQGFRIVHVSGTGEATLRARQQFWDNTINPNAKFKNFSGLTGFNIPDDEQKIEFFVSGETVLTLAGGDNGYFVAPRGLIARRTEIFEPDILINNVVNPTLEFKSSTNFEPEHGLKIQDGTTQAGFTKFSEGTRLDYIFVVNNATASARSILRVFQNSTATGGHGGIEVARAEGASNQIHTKFGYDMDARINGLGGQQLAINKMSAESTYAVDINGDLIIDALRIRTPSNNHYDLPDNRGQSGYSLVSNGAGGTTWQLVETTIASAVVPSDSIQNDAGINYVRTSAAADSLRIGVNNVDVITITSGRQVGIGTSAPAAKLDVQDATLATIRVRKSTAPIGSHFNMYHSFPLAGGISFNTFNSAKFHIDAIPSIIKDSEIAINQFVDTTQTTGVRFYNGRATPEVNHQLMFGTNSFLCAISGGGYLGIGTATPEQLLHVEGSGEPHIRLKKSGTDAGSHLQLIHSGENIGSIKFSAPGESLLNINAITASSNSQALVRINRDTDTSAMNGFLVFKGDNTTTVNHRLVNNANSYLVANNGNLGVGTASPSSKLHIKGSVRVSANGSSYLLPTGAGANGQVLTQSSSAQTYWATKGDPAVTQYYESPNTGALGSLGNVGFLHGLGGVPRSVQLSFVCVVANGGYIVGDEVTPLGWQTNADADNGVSVWWSATQVGASRNGTVRAATKLGGAFAFLNTTNWRYKFRAMR